MHGITEQFWFSSYCNGWEPDPTPSSASFPHHLHTYPRVLPQAAARPSGGAGAAASGGLDQGAAGEPGGPAGEVWGWVGWGGGKGVVMEGERAGGVCGGGCAPSWAAFLLPGWLGWGGVGGGCGAGLFWGGDGGGTCVGIVWGVCGSPMACEGGETGGVCGRALVPGALSSAAAPGVPPLCRRCHNNDSLTPAPAHRCCATAQVRSTVRTWTLSLTTAHAWPL